MKRNKNADIRFLLQLFSKSQREKKKKKKKIGKTFFVSAGALP